MKYITKLLIIFALVSTAIMTFAEESWKQSLSLGVNVNKGNTESELYNAGFSGEYLKEQQKLNFKVNYNYGSEDEDKSVDNSLFELKYNYLINDSFYILMLLLAEADDIAALDHRFSAGPGAGINLINKDIIKLSVEAGISWMEEEYDNQSADEFTALRIAQEFEYIFTTQARFKESVEYNLNLDDNEDYLLKSNVAVETILTKNINLKLSLKNTYTNLPAADKEKQDTTFTTVLVFNI